MDRRQFLGASAATLLASQPSWAQQRQFFRIGTGGISGTYYPIGGLIADIVSKPSGSRPCDRGGDCGVPGLVALAQTSLGSVANIRAIIAQEIESGFAQSDIAYGAFAGSGVFAGEPPASDLRAIANLYPESMHLLVSAESGIKSVGDLRGKRVSLDELGSGTLVDALLLLGAYNIGVSDIQAVNVKPGVAIGMMQDGEIDALFVIAGYPASSVMELIDTIGAQLVPIAGPETDKLLEQRPFFTPGTIPAAAYGLPEDTATLNVGAQWLTSLRADEELIYQLTRTLWSDYARATLDSGHPKGQEITLETALDGIAVPLHPGAARYYRERRMIVH